MKRKKQDNYKRNKLLDYLIMARQTQGKTEIKTEGIKSIGLLKTMLINR